ncbi:MAG: hypothetical protein M1827_005183 [Pycnora praestabilis]|nr:MAG: hypothetical protein M1827_005183 [Pycnora praestabilis]
MVKGTPSALPHDDINSRYLPPLQTSFNANKDRRRQRERPGEIPSSQPQGKRVPLTPQSPPLKRQQSRAGLLSLFTRSKSNHNTTPETIDRRAKSVDIVERPLTNTTARSVVNTTTTSTGRNVTVSSQPAPPPLLSKPSRMALRSRSQKTTSSQRTVAAWDPPPLFQAYPQAIKHASLQAPTQSASALLRAHQQKQSFDLGEEKTVGSEESIYGEAEVGAKKANKVLGNHKRRMSSSNANSDWTQKIYVLVTSGYLLQYAGDGPFDRLPEKIMQLGKDSVAFASDVIPGKHWVLQISQVSDDEGPIAGVSSKSFLSKWGLRGASARRATSTLLLILHSAEEMDSWIFTTRKEIEALGGKKYRPANGARRNSSGSAPQLRQRPIQRYLIKRDPNQFSNPPSPSVTSSDPTSELARMTIPKGDPPQDLNMRKASDTVSIKSSKRYSVVSRSTETPSIANTVISTDQLALDPLREGSRLSYISAGTRTMTTSRGSSPTDSPIKEIFLTGSSLDAGGVGGSSNSLAAAAAISASNSRRVSMSTLPTTHEIPRPSLEMRHSSTDSQPRSAYARAERSSLRRSPSPSAHNFSVPSFSKRYSLANAAPLPPPTPPAPISRARSEPPAERPASTVGSLPTPAELAARPSKARFSVPPKDLLYVVHSNPNGNITKDQPSSAGSLVPRRFSSLEYSKGVLPVPSSELIHRPTSANSAQQKKLRRPNSMQIGSNSVSESNTTSLISTSLYNDVHHEFKVQGRKSMPALVIGPPPLPPPDCPLPAPPQLSVDGSPTVRLAPHYIAV